MLMQPISTSPPPPFPKQTQLAFGLYFTVIDAYFIREFTVFLWFFGTLVLLSSNPLAPIIISTVLITDNKKTLTTLMYCRYIIVQTISYIDFELGMIKKYNYNYSLREQMIFRLV